MKILIHSAYYAPELIAIGKYNAELAVWLRSRGHDVRVVAMVPHFPSWRVMPGYSARWYSRDQQDGVPVWRCPSWIPARPSGLHRLLWMGTFALSSLPVMLRHALWRPDVVIGVEPPLVAFVAARLCAALSGARLWLHVQDLEVDAAFDLGVLRGRRARQLALWLERMLMRGCDRVSTISDRMADRLRDKGVPDSRLVRFRNWVSIGVPGGADASQRWRDELGLLAHEKLVLYAGNMGAKQGLETVIDAARCLAARTDIRFLLVGEGPTLARLQALSVDLPRVSFLPIQPADRFGDLLRAADVHLLPQRRQAADLVMPSKLAGMLASGRPTVAGADAGTELAEALAGRGLVVPPEDGAAFAAAIATLVDDPQLAGTLGAAACSYARQELDKESVLRRFEQQLLGLLVKAPRPAVLPGRGAG